MLRLLVDEDAFRFDTTLQPEFDHWRWVDYWRPVKEVVHFKREVYSRALQELAHLLGYEKQKTSLVQDASRR